MKDESPKPRRFSIVSGGKANEKTPPAPTEAPPLFAPPWLSVYGREQWDRLCPLLVRYGVVADVDASVLAAYCEASADFRRAREALRDEPLVIERRLGHGATKAVTSPWFTASCTAARQMQALGAELGLSPASRSGIVAHNKQRPGDDSDPFGLFQ